MGQLHPAATETSGWRSLSSRAGVEVPGPLLDRRPDLGRSDHRGGSKHEVTFWAREGKTTGGDDHRIPVTLPIEEFTRRWSLHILPKGYTKTRRFGGWSNRRRDRYLERCAILLEATSVPFSACATEFDPFLFLEQECEST